MIRLEQMSFGYGAKPVLQDVNLQLDQGQLVYLVGANGSGKTTLFRLLLSQLKPQQGRVLIQGQDTHSLSPRLRAGLISYIPQNHDYSYDFLVSDMVLMGCSRFHRWYQRPGRNDVERMEAGLERLQILGLRDRLFRSLSGGERQLVLLARALMQEAQVILMDEVSANLDLHHQLMVMQRARQLSREGYLVVVATHQLEWPFRYADCLLVAEEARITSHRQLDSGALLEQLCRVYRCPLKLVRLPDGHTLVLPSAEALQIPT